MKSNLPKILLVSITTFATTLSTLAAKEPVVVPAPSTGCVVTLKVILDLNERHAQKFNPYLNDHWSVLTEILERKNYIVQSGNPSLRYDAELTIVYNQDELEFPGSFPPIGLGAYGSISWETDSKVQGHDSRYFRIDFFNYSLNRRSIKRRIRKVEEAIEYSVTPCH